jgi:hypothetical protein
VYGTKTNRLEGALIWSAGVRANAVMEDAMNDGASSSSPATRSARSERSALKTVRYLRQALSLITSYLSRKAARGR